MKTPMTGRLLDGILKLEDWTQQDLQTRTQIDRTIISLHLANRRPIRDEHLVAYIAAVPIPDKGPLLAAWLRDVLPANDIEILLDAGNCRLKETVADWLPELPGDLKQRLSWLADQMLRDPELQSAMSTLIRSFGYTAP